MGNLVLIVVLLLSVVPFCLSFCPDKCVCDDERLETSCISTNLEVMPMTLNPSMMILILKHNDFHSVDASLNFYQELELVDLSWNHLVSIPDRAFSNQRRLVQLRINSNKISKLSERTFSGLGKLQVLNLQENVLDHLPNRAFKGLKTLMELQLGNNRISEIGKRAFVNLDELTILDLSDNLLETIPTEALKQLPNLADLNLANNNIKLIVDQSFTNSRLSILDLSGNMIERIHEKAFSQVSLIRQLDLQDNQLYQVPSEALKNFEKLEYLNIGQNKFSVIDENAFIHLEKLTKLDISGCSSLKEVQANAFSTLADLEYVKISSNRKLDLIHPEAFGAKPFLKHVDLSNNALSSVSPALVPWMSLSSVDLSGNPWHCDCQNSFMKNVIIDTVNKSDSIRIVRCWNPPTLRDRDIAFLNMDCEVVQSPNTDQSASNIDSNTAILAVICSSAIVISVVILAMIIKSRKLVISCAKSAFYDTDHIPVSSSKILQYQPYQEPQYVSHYMEVPTLKLGIRLNTYENHQTLFRHDHYFLALASPEKGIPQDDQICQQTNAIKGCDIGMYMDVQHNERIYQRIEDPISEI